MIDRKTGMSMKRVLNSGSALLELLTGVGLISVFVGFCSVVVYAFVSSSYLGPILAAVAGVVVIVIGITIGMVGKNAGGSNATCGMFLVFGVFMVSTGGAGTLAHVLLVHVLHDHF
jgi:hypothetical protein